MQEAQALVFTTKRLYVFTVHFWRGNSSFSHKVTMEREEGVGFKLEPSGITWLTVFVKTGAAAGDSARLEGGVQASVCVCACMRVCVLGELTEKRNCHLGYQGDQFAKNQGIKQDF